MKHFMLIKYTSNSITNALPVQVYRQTDFTPKRVVVSRLHATVCEISYRSDILAPVQQLE